MLLYLARGHYDSDDLKAAKQYLLRAIHIAPTDYKLRFNAALTMQVSGCCTCLTLRSTLLCWSVGVGGTSVPQEAYRR